MSLAKQIHVGLLPWYLAPLAGLHMQVRKLIVDLLRTVTSHTALFQCIVIIIAILS